MSTYFPLAIISHLLVISSYLHCTMLQGMCARDPELAKAAVGVAKTFGVAFMGLAGTQHQLAAKELGVPFLAEWFAGTYLI